MKSKLFKIIGLGLLLVLLGGLYMSKDHFRILWIQRKAILNYEANIEKFTSLMSSNNSDCFYNLGVENNDSIRLFISNFDMNNFSFIGNQDIHDYLERCNNAITLKSDTLNLESLSILHHGGLKFDAREESTVVYDWNIYFHGSRFDPTLSVLLSKLNIDEETLKKRLFALERINCRWLFTHEDDILELIFEEGLVMKGGCIIKKWYPVRYSIGKSSLLQRKLRGMKELDDSIQCYIDF